MNVAIIGYETIGKEITKEMKKKDIDAVYTIDSEKKYGADYQSLTTFNSEHMADVYIICLQTKKEILDVIKEIKLDNRPLISIETSCEFGIYGEIREIIGESADLIIFQERYVDNDPDHGIFNQKRVMGGNYIRGTQFYSRYMLYDNIVVTKYPGIAELCKIFESAYIYTNVALSKEIQMITGEYFDELLRIIKTRYDIIDPRANILTESIDKDVKLVNKRFQNTIIKSAVESYEKNKSL